MIAQENRDRTRRMQSTTRATQPVCSSKANGLAKMISARPEMISPRKKINKSLPNNRSTRIQEGQTIRPLKVLFGAHRETAGNRANAAPRSIQGVGRFSPAQTKAETCTRSRSKESNRCRCKKVWQLGPEVRRRFWQRPAVALRAS